MRLLPILIALVACQPEPVDTDRPASGTPAGTLVGTLTGGSGITTDTGTTTSTVTTTYDCTTPWPASMGATQVSSGIASTEDFDITADGYIVHVESGNLVKRSYNGQDTILISPNVTNNAAGTRVLRNGDVVVADVSGGTLILVDHVTGTKTTLFNANWPNGIDVDRDDNIYITDFADQGTITRINAYNPTDRETIASNMNRPNGVVLTPDGQTLIIAANWSNQLWAIDKQVDGTWSGVRVFQNNPGSAQSVTTDVCGTVYWESGSDVWRKRQDGTDGGPVLQGGAGYFPNLRFGNDVGGFKRDYLYGLSNNALFEFHVGVPGKKHISLQ